MSMFEQRYCAFVDIIGFSHRVEELERNWDQGAYERLRSCLRFIDDEQHESAYSADLPIHVEEDGRVVEKELGDPRLTYISDCLVASTERTPDGFKALCRKVTKVWLDLVWDGYWCRGGISAGPLIHEPSCIMGTAYMSAYRLEGEAKVPRMVIHKSLSEVYEAFPGEFPTCPPTMERGDGGFLYLRYFPCCFFPPYVPSWSDFLLRARGHIVNGLLNTTDYDRPKYLFVRDEFNFALQLYRDAVDPIVLPITNE